MIGKNDEHCVSQDILWHEADIEARSPAPECPSTKQWNKQAMLYGDFYHMANKSKKNVSSVI